MLLHAYLSPGAPGPGRVTQAAGSTARLVLDRATPCVMLGNICAFAVLCLILIAGGCNGMNAALEDSARLTEIQALKDKNASQARLLVQRDEQLRDQAEIIRSLRDLPRGLKLADLIHVDRIEIAGLSGGYDADEDGIDDGVRVYLRPYDQYGGALRATGKARVRLYDLDDPAGTQSVGEVVLEPEALGPLWFGRFLTSHYTIDVPWSGGAKTARHPHITIAVTFTDLLSGRSFEARSNVIVSTGSIARSP